MGISKTLQEFDICEMNKIIMQIDDCIHTIYNVLRIPAKEVLVALISDIDRIRKAEKKIHAIPIAYGMSGYSSKVNSLRSMSHELVSVCTDKDIDARALSTDGQFYQLCDLQKIMHL